MFSIYGQTHKSNIDDDVLITYISNPPYYTGGIDSMKSFIARNLQYPQFALEDKVKGTVFVSFLVDTNGLTIDHKVVRSVRNDLDEEALRVSRLIVFFQPAKQKDKPIKVPFTIPFKFELPESEALKDEDTFEEIGRWVPEESPIYRFDKYEGSLISLRPILSDSIRCPFENCDSISGRIIIQFFVQANGEISDIKVRKGINDSIDKEVVRVIEHLKCIRPAYIRKKPVKHKEIIGFTVNFPS